MGSVSLKSHAKINLFLEVEGPRPDGFHDLDTLFLEIGFADTLRIECDESGPPECQIVCTDPRIPTDRSNLVYQASETWQRTQGHLKVRLEKEIPAGGGLGGGSSNAAAMLQYLRASRKVRAERDSWLNTALSLGSDVPFFLDGNCQRGRGRGEVLTSVPVPDLALVLVLPPISCSTAAVFKSLRSTNYDYARQSPAPMLAELPNLVSRDNPGYQSSLQRFVTTLFNRLEVVSLQLWPELQAYKSALLEAGALGALMSGSGSTLFGVARDPDHAREIAKKIPDSHVTETRRPETVSGNNDVSP